MSSSTEVETLWTETVDSLDSGDNRNNPWP